MKLRFLVLKFKGYSFGYGFVEYVNEADATKAIDAFNGYQIEHKHLKVAFARPNNQDTRNTNLYIRNIPVNFDEQQLRNLFSNYGEVVQVRILRDQTTAFSKRVGFVIMATKQMASNAIQNLNNLIVPNTGSTEPMLVKYADEDGKGKKNSHRGGGGGGGHHNRHNNNNNNNGAFGANNIPMNMQNYYNNNNNNNNNYMMNQQQGMSGGGGFNFNNPNSFMMPANGLNSIQNLGKMKNSRSATNGRYNPLNQAASAAGMASNQFGAAQQLTSSNSYQWPGSGTIQPYSTGASAQQAALSGFDNLIGSIGTRGGGGGGGGGGVQTQQATFGAAALGAKESGQMIYVYGVGSHATESDLYSLFSTFGGISRVNVVKHPKTGTCKGYGFVLFETYDEACYAVQNMNGFSYNNRPLQVSLKMNQS